MKELYDIINLFKLQGEYNFSSFIIEEPEQNLFPETQRDFIYFLLDKITNTEREHTVLLTTHSPYILYALNNCMLGKTVEQEMTDDEKNSLLSNKSWVDTALVSVWEIEKDKGTLKSIKDEKIGTVSKHYFNKITNDVMDEYYEMLSHLHLSV
jgi:predicted ATPase